MLALVATSSAGEGEPKLWSFRPPLPQPLPTVVDEAWPRTPVDRFVLARLEEKGLRPTPDADPHTLVRRAYFDLVGLPPSAEIVEAFARNPSRSHLERMVDGLLSLPAFGERWGRHWLDVARFAESAGGGRSSIFRNAWRYRDYVIESFNVDRPFDEFIREQIAGDLYADAKTDSGPITESGLETTRRRLIATGFLALGPKNLDDQNKDSLRLDVIDEQLDTIGQAVLGLTLGCARCHDHKFDPISARDYYALAGFLWNTKTLIDANVSVPVQRELPTSGAHRDALRKHGESLADLTERLKKARAEHTRAQEALLAAVGPENLPGVVVDDTNATIVGDWKRSTSVEGFLGEHYLHDENTGKGTKSVRFVALLPSTGDYEVRLSYTPGTNRSERVSVTVEHAGGEKVIAVDQRKPPSIDGRFVSLGTFPFTKGRENAVTISNRDTTAHVIADAVQFLSKAPTSETPEEASKAPDGLRIAALKEGRDAARARVTGLEKKIEALRADAPPPAPKALGVVDVENPEDCHVRLQGLASALGDRVPRGFLSVITPSPPEIPPKQSGRRELAEWLASPRNPLTSRVFVNRVWHHLFGAGLVRTVDNFGAMGERPSHPELLDWLALRFVALKWSPKRLIREIVLSRTYALSGGAPPATDPENRWLSRHSSRRVDAEFFRDALLVVGGRLDETHGGPTIPATTSTEFGYQFRSVRRSVYLPVFRNARPEIFEVFDMADPNMTMGRRNRSTLPTQALYLMNHPFVMEQSRLAAAARLERPDLTDAEGVRQAYLKTLGRPPSVREREIALRHVGAAAPENGSKNDEDDEAVLNAWEGLYQALVSSLDFRYVY